MNDAKTTNILLALLVALHLWQLASSTPGVRADDPTEVRVEDHRISIFNPVPVKIIEK